MRLVSGVAVVLLLLAGCSDDDPATEPSGPTSTPTVARWNPCDAIDEAQVSDQLGTTFTMETGTATEPVCRLTPDSEGGPAVDANYMLFAEGLEAVFEAMPDLDPDDVREVQVAGADAARIVVDFDETQLFVSGFVENGDLIQTVDVVDPQPYDEQRVVRAVRTILGRLSDAAPSQ